MKIKNILYVFLLINIMIAPAIHAMEQPNKQKTEQPSPRPYPSNLPRLLLSGCLKNEESCLSKLPMELIVEIINHIRKIQKDQDLLNARNDRDLLDAVIVNDENGVRRLLKEPYIDANIKDENGCMPLFWAISNNHSEIVKMLLDKGAHLDMQDAYGGRTPLIWALRCNKSTIAQILIDKGAHLDIRDDLGCTALHWAVIQNNQEIVQILIDQGANIDIQDNEGHNLLYWAVRNNKPEIVRILLDKGADPNMAGNDRYTPLYWALEKNNEAIINLIIEAKENLDSTFDNNDHFLLNVNNDLDLLKAVKANNENEVKQLLNEHYIDVNVKDEKGYTPLIWAIRNMSPEIVQMLLEEGANPDIPDSDGWTALIWAAEKDNEAIINLIIDAKEKLDSVGTSGS